ncbi:MAG: hypothetical protein IAB78_05610 [Bacteroidetes bacterium]|uniref:Peptidyl-prolyl cis-trans isomerase n=1 Tax=Candidatus Cryptobacteroides excrementavium TaxID=2840759 RepID=A0A9D9NS25_9BACT|nr:hypothetical protein [Candidatus Cryptobacteroides excrementavium]
MGHTVRIIFICGIALLTLSSCRAISSLLHDDDVVAEVGHHMLFRSDVASLIPDGTSPEDSLRLALQYINIWASDLVFLDIAEEQLSKEELDVSAELEEYRRSLLKYRYEQRYVNERLDTLVSDFQIDEYYQTHVENFVLDIPIVKARFLRIDAASPNLEVIRKKMSSSQMQDLVEADSLSYFSAVKYTGFGDRWIDMVTLAKEFGRDYAELLASMKNGIIQTQDEYGKANVAYIADFIPAGEIPPVEYCRDRIKDIIISIRKQALVSALEQDLLEDARDKGKFKIF